MKKTALLNAPLSKIIARMGHGDNLVLADSGLPIPYDKSVVDLAVTPQLPRLLDVLSVILTELKVEKIIITHEMQKKSPQYYQDLHVLLERIIPEVPVEKISHDQLKQYTREMPSISFVRTGEATPFANLILVAGVIF